MRAAVALIAVAACGRLHFAERSDAAGDATGDGGGVRVTLRLDRVDPGEALTDFPLLVVLDDTRADRTRLAADASDLQFYDSDGHVLPREIEQVGAPGGPPLVAWVRVPVIVGLTTTIDMQYGVPAAGSPDPVWTSSYVAVWHLSDATTARDSTGAFDATASGTTPIAGMIGGGRDFASGDYLIVPDTVAITPAQLTVSGWMLAHAAPSAYYALLAREVADTSDDDMYLGIYVGPDADFETETANVANVAIGGPVAIGSWIHLVGTADGTIEKLYLDGVEVGAVACGPLQSDVRPIFLGADRDDNSVPVTTPENDFLFGALDEVRIESVVRDFGWIAYEDVAMRDQVITYPPGP